MLGYNPVVCIFFGCNCDNYYAKICLGCYNAKRIRSSKGYLSINIQTVSDAELRNEILENSWLKILQIKTALLQLMNPLPNPLVAAQNSLEKMSSMLVNGFTSETWICS